MNTSGTIVIYPNKIATLVLPKSVDASRDFGHFLSTEQHADCCIWLASYYLLLVIYSGSLGGTVVKLLVIKVSSTTIPNQKKDVTGHLQSDFCYMTTKNEIINNI